MLGSRSSKENENPKGIWRMVNGAMSREPLPA